MNDALPSFLLAAFALTGSPGPNTLSVAAVGASFGRMRGLKYMAGLNAGVFAVIALVGTGISGAVMALPGIAPVVSIAAALYFLYLAFRIATAPPLSDTSAIELDTAPRWYEGFALSLANPKAYAAMAALFSGHTLINGNNVADALWKTGILILVICIVNFAWLSIGAGLSRLLQNPRTSRIVNICFAALLLLSVAAVALKGF